MNNIKPKQSMATYCAPSTIIIALSIFAIIIICNTNDFISTITSAVIGAGAAFYFNVYASRKEHKLRNIADLKETKYILEIILKQNQMIKEHIDSCLKNNCKGKDYYDWGKITEFFPSILPDINTKSLIFLSDHNEQGKDTLDCIFLVYFENQQVISSLEERNNRFYSYLDKTEDRDSLAKKDLEKRLGTLNFMYLTNWTKTLIKNNKNLLESCPKAIHKVENFLLSNEK